MGAAEATPATWQPQRSLFDWLRISRRRWWRSTAPSGCTVTTRLFGSARSTTPTASRSTPSATSGCRPRTVFADALIDAALRHDVPVALMEHGEHGSRQHNGWEAELAATIVRGCLELGLDAREGIGVVVPHRAQRAALRELLPALPARTRWIRLSASRAASAT